MLFLETADPIQLRYVGKEWKNLVEYTEEIARGCGSVCLMWPHTTRGHGANTLAAEPRYCANAVGYDSA